MWRGRPALKFGKRSCDEVEYSLHVTESREVRLSRTQSDVRRSMELIRDCTVVPASATVVRKDVKLLQEVSAMTGTTVNYQKDG